MVSLFLWFGFERGTADFQFVEEVPWFPEFNIAYRVGIDGISLFFVLLSTFLTPICILASWESIQTRVKEYMIAFLVLENFHGRHVLRVGFLCLLRLLRGRSDPDVPDHRHLGRRASASTRRSSSSCYTFLGSVLMLIAILAMYWEVG